MLNIKILTLGCAKNTVDSEKIAGNLKTNNINVSFCNEPQKCDILIINTCGFILDAKEESIEAILEAIELKKQHQIKKIYVTGCLSTRYLNDLSESIPEVDKYFTVRNFNEIQHEILKQTSNFQNKRIISTPHHYAYIKIAEGCNRKCSFCAIPSIRGRYKSIPIEILIKEAHDLSQQGVKELILVAQDLTYYGKDLYQKPSLYNLLLELTKNTSFDWIRLHYTYPQYFSDELIDLIASTPSICKYIDLPIQHISDNVLKLMRRGTSKKSIIQLIEKLRKRIPELHIRTTVIIGHPGETKKDFEELVDFIKAYRFEKLGAFIYSHEDNTYAEKHYKDNIPKNVKQERLYHIMNIQQDISSEINHSFIGTTQRVIIDRKENDFYIGRTQYDSPEIDNEVLIKSLYSLKVGDFYSVNITDAFEFDLVAEIKS